MAGEKSKTAVLTTQFNELQKTRYFYDGNGRQTFMVQAARDVAHGGPALVTKFGYADADSTQIESTREYEGTWDQAWDIEEETPS